jgi:hypothetical protein
MQVIADSTALAIDASSSSSSTAVSVHGFVPPDRSDQSRARSTSNADRVNCPICHTPIGVNGLLQHQLGERCQRMLNQRRSTTGSRARSERSMAPNGSQPPQQQ